MSCSPMRRAVSSVLCVSKSSMTIFSCMVGLRFAVWFKYGGKDRSKIPIYSHPCRPTWEWLAFSPVFLPVASYAIGVACNAMTHGIRCYRYQHSM